MDIDAALDLARDQRRSLMVTLKSDGHPQLSNVLHLVRGDGTVHVSITADRAKYHNLVRDPWVALHVTTPDFWSYAVLEGTAALTPVAAAPGDPTVDALVEYYRAASGEHPDWDEYRAAMVSERRVLATVTPARAYGALR